MAWDLNKVEEREAFAKKVESQFKRRDLRLSCAEIAENLRATQIQVRRVLNYLVESRVLVSEGNTRNTRYFLA